MQKRLILIFAFIFLLYSICFAENILPKIDFVDANLIDIVQALALQAKMDIIISTDASIQKKVTLHLKNSTAEDAIDYVLRTNGYSYEKKGNSIVVSTLPLDLSQSGYKKTSKTVELKYISAEKAVSIINKIMPDLLIVAGERANRIVLRGRESDTLEIAGLLDKIDQPIPQVLIEGRIYEVAKSDSLKLGLDYNNGTFQFINAKHEDMTTTLNTLLANGQANIIATPRIATLDNNEAIINIGNRIPYAVPVSSSGSLTQWSVEYIQAGVQLKITPRIGKDNQIIVSLEPEVSNISEWRTTAAGDFPVISTRNAKATLRTRDGETIVVGGLDSETERVNTSRIPIIGQFPGLNLLFQNRTVEKTKTEIVFMITPHVI